MKLAIVGAGLALQFSAAAMVLAADGKGSGPELALLYDFYGVEGADVPDGSGHRRTGKLEAGTIVQGREKPAVRFAGEGSITTSLNPQGLDFAGRPMTVGAMCKPSGPDGVIVSMGDASEGFSLYLRRGVPHFAVRTGGVLHQVAAPEAVDVDAWVHLAGVIDQNGELSVLVNTWPAARSEGSLLARRPAEPLSVGADAGAFVGDYAAPLHWQGLLQDVRLYWGAVNREDHRDLLGEWAMRPGCGCRK